MTVYEHDTLTLTYGTVQQKGNANCLGGNIKLNRRGVENASAVKVLTMLGESHNYLKKLSRTLRAMPSVKRVSNGISVTFFSSLDVDLYVVADLINGDTLSWDVEITFSEGLWCIEPSISITKNIPRSTPDVLVEFDIIKVGSVDDCEKSVEFALSELEKHLSIVQSITPS